MLVLPPQHFLHASRHPGIGALFFRLLLCFCMVVHFGGCTSTERDPLDVNAPTVTAIPAGGVYKTLPTILTLHSEAGAILSYRWNDGKTQRYAAPIAIPPIGPPHRTLSMWAEDITGNRSPIQREHYVELPTVPQVEILALDRLTLGPQDSTTLRWRSDTTVATYELAVTSGGWGAGRQLATGSVTTDAIHEVTIAGTSLFPGTNRLWLRVKNRAGMQGMTSRQLTLYNTAAPTRIWPPSGVYGRAQTVALVTARPAIIYYTLDGTEPTQASIRYMQPFTLDRSATVRYMSVDQYGNREAPQHARFTIQPNTATIVMPRLIPRHVTNSTPLTVVWQSDNGGRYDVILEHVQSRHRITIEQGRVQRDTPRQTVIAQHFLKPGDWRVHLRIDPENGRAGTIAFSISVSYLETFVDTRNRDTDLTTTLWDIDQQQVQLAHGLRQLGSYRTKGRSRQVTLHGTYAYVANGKGGLHIVDVSEPQQPRRASVFYPHGKAMALAKHRHYVYMAASGSGVVIFDVERPYRPTPVAMINVPGAAADILIAAPFAYIGTKQGRVVIYDLSTPLQPRMVGHVDVCETVVDMATAPGRLYVACLDRGVAVVDIRTPHQPQILRLLPTSSAATGVAVYGHQVFVAAGALDVFDITDVTTPQRRSHNGVRQAYGVAIRPPYVVIAAGPDGIQLVPIDGYETPMRIPTAHYAARMAFTDNLTLIADTRGGLQLFDHTHHATPKRLAALDDIGTIVDVLVDGSVAYLADDRYGNGLVVVNLEGHGAPYFIGQYHTDVTTDVVVHNGWAVVSDAAGILQVVDVHQPHRPQLHSTMLLPGKHQRLALRPPHLLVASDDGTVHSVELRSDGSLHHRKTLSLPGRALDIALDGTMAYIAAVEGGIQVLDVSVPQHPILLPPYHHPDGHGDHIIRLAVDRGVLYVLDNVRGIQILRHTDAGMLRLVASVTVPTGAPWGVTVMAPYLFVTTLLNTLYVLDVQAPSAPKIIGSAPYGGAALTARDNLLYIAVRGRQGVPGGLRLVDAFETVSDEVASSLRSRGIALLPGATATTYRAPRTSLFQTPGVSVSTGVTLSDASAAIVRMRVDDFWGVSGKIRYELTNDDGGTWYQVQPGTWFHFPQPGTVLRWRALLETDDVLQTPIITAISLDYLLMSQ